MILYCAGNMNPEVLGEMAERTESRNWLETNAHKGSRDVAIYFAKDKPKFRLFIDSGAFTAWAKGTEINLDEYIGFCKEIEELSCFSQYPVVYAALDVIAGNRDATTEPTAADFEKSSAQGWANYLKMKAAGVQSIPTFHQGDETSATGWKWFDMMLDDTDYVALSPRKVNKTTAEKATWINDCFKRIDARGQLPGNCRDGKHPIRTHGLGIASPVFMETYPFYSVDSTAWIHCGSSMYAVYFDGRRRNLVLPREWKDNTSFTLSSVHHYYPQGKANLVYYFHEKGIGADAELETHITNHWRERGVTWE